MSRRLRAEDGFTVVEMLVATIVLGIVVVGALTMMEVVMRQGRGVLERTDAAQHGRLALDRMTRQIRSQVCRDQFTGGLISASGTSLSFYTDLGDGGRGPSKHTLTFDPTTRRVTEQVWPSTTAPPAAPSYNTSPARDTVIMQDVVQDDAKPFFSFYAYDTTTTPPTLNVRLAPTGAALTAAELPKTAMIHLQFKVRPTGGRDDSFAVPLQDDVFFRNADPNAARPDPTCI